MRVRVQLLSAYKFYKSIDVSLEANGFGFKQPQERKNVERRDGNRCECLSSASPQPYMAFFVVIFSVIFLSTLRAPFMFFLNITNFRLLILLFPAFSMDFKLQHLEFFASFTYSNFFIITCSFQLVFSLQPIFLFCRGCHSLMSPNNFPKSILNPI